MPHDHHRDSSFRTPLPSNPVVLLSLDEMVARIEAIRLEAAPACCPACGSVSLLAAARRCTRCRKVKPLDGGFNRRSNRPNGAGYRSICRECNRLASKRWRTKQALRIIGRAS